MADTGHGRLQQANIFHMVNSLAIAAIENGSEQITNEAVESWVSEFDAEAAFA